MNADCYIWSNQHRAWWRPNSKGYTTSIHAAGVYSHDEAISICANCRDGWLASETPTEIPVRVNDVNVCINIDADKRKNLPKSADPWKPWEAE